MIRVFPSRNKWTPDDELSFVGDPPLFRPHEMPVKISVTFTWDIDEGERLYNAWKQYYQDVQIGGPAYGDSGDGFTPGMFIKNGVTFTSRGCPFNCPWCFVPRREGKIRELEIRPGYIIQDNNLLACSRQHIKKVFALLKQQKRAAIFSGGLDSRLLKDWHVELLKSINIHEMWFAADSQERLSDLKKIAPKLKDFPANKKRCYVLIGYPGESITAAEDRLREVYELGFYPFAQLYQWNEKTGYNRAWKNLQRNWSRPAIYRFVMTAVSNNIPIDSAG